jgi:hypothetical protein
MASIDFDSAPQRGSVYAANQVRFAARDTEALSAGQR